MRVKLSASKYQSLQSGKYSGEPDHSVSAKIHASIPEENVFENWSEKKRPDQIYSLLSSKIGTKMNDRNS